MALFFASTARGGGVGLLTTAKTIPPATVAVIDPESGTSSGGGTTDVRVGVGDIILFRFRYMPVPEGQLVGVNGWLTEYIPPNLQVVGVRLMDEDGLTIQPSLPGLAENGYGSRSNNWDSIATCTGDTCPVAAGGMAQVYQDTGLFYSTDPDTARLPSDTFITLQNGLEYATPSQLTNDANLRDALGAEPPYHAHNAWDFAQVSLLGSYGGNTPHLYGSPVAGPETHYSYEVTDNGASFELASEIGPWNRIQYPGSTIATGGPASSSGGDGMGRYVDDASSMGLDLTPNNPLPHVGDGAATSANALRIAIGQVHAGRPIFVEIAFRVMGTPLDPGFGTMGGDVNCGESFGGDISGHLASHDADDHMWGYFVPSPACVFLNLLFDITADDVVRSNDEAYNDIEYTIRARNLSLNPRHNVWVRQKYDGNRLSLSDDAARPPFPDMAPTCELDNCDGDGQACVFWNLGTLEPSEEISIRTNLEVTNQGNPTTPVRADFTSDDLGVRSGDPCAGGSIADPGFRTQELVQMRTLGVLGATLSQSPTTPNAGSPGFAEMTGSITVEGTQSLTVGDIWVPLPDNWTVGDTGGALTPDITVDGVVYECSADCSTSRPRFDGVNVSIAQNTSVPITFRVSVPGGTPAGNYPIDLEMWSSQSGYGGTKEYYFDNIALVSVGGVRSEPPVLDCPVLSSWSSIPGSTTEADGTIIRVFFNGIQRGEDPAAGGRFDVVDSPDGVTPWHGPGGTFGSLYGGLEVRATAQAPGENESELSDACFVTQVSQCQDGLDNDGDGLVDFPADPGCSSPSDGDENDPECNDGVDNDMDGDVDWPDDLECRGPDDDSEGDPPACQDGLDNDEDGLVDTSDPDCDSSTDRTEVTLRRCMNGVDDDLDGFADFPEDPGCHSSNDDDEADFAYPPDDIRARLLLVFDTSGSMNWHTCADEFTQGDGSDACPGSPVSCETCDTAGCDNLLPDDSRIFQARQGLTNVVAGFGEVEYGLMRFHQRPREFDCPSDNASGGSGGWQGAGAAPCGGGFAGGDLLVGFSPENEYDLLEWMDNDTNHQGTPPPGLDLELRGTGTTPIAGSLQDALGYLDGVRDDDAAAACRPYRVILITDGQETCGGDPVAAADDLRLAGYPTYVIGFATDDPAVRSDLDAIADAGGTTSAIFADDSTTLSAAVSDIVNDSILTEICNGIDDDCDGLTDEGYTLYCDVQGGTTDPVLCADPGETVCDGVDDNCNGEVDEGLRNACGTCGAAPTETCNRTDDDCDGVIDEHLDCTGCVVEPEICDGSDNDCDMAVDEGLSRSCGNDVGACTPGTETCSMGTWGSCTGQGPTAEECDGIDNDCDGVVDQITQPCSTGSDVGACTPGTETCVDGSWSAMCTGGIGPTTEICDGIDNNCDGEVDEGNPGGGASCGSDIGACTAGMVTCIGGELICQGATTGGPEACNSTDDDCDGRVDEEVPTGASCGDCGEGVLTCVGGDFVCRGDRAPTAETCNGLDDNCDGVVDEGNPGGGLSCGSDTGLCTPGTTNCVEGSIVCEDATGPTAELCNDLDEDCDGLIDEGNPEGGGSCGLTDEGECELGVETCDEGALICRGATAPSDERCDGLDNDCDGLIDEEDPGGGAACGDDTGACESGTRRCVEGGLVCEGSVGPSEEVCNNIDDDCDGVVDDGLDVGAPCGSDIGECVPGLLICVEGDVVCDGAVRPAEETCNALDDDCDGVVDEELPLGGECGDTEGACVPGMVQCLDGREVCVGEVPAGPEVCDCEDNDCDGLVDETPTEGSLCPGDSVCLDCSCALPCLDSEFGRCPEGRLLQETEDGCFCVAPRCNAETCAMDTITIDGQPQCAPADPTVPECECRMNECTFPCDGVVCGDPTVCHPETGECVEDNCRGLGCSDGQICDVIALECVADPCLDAGCGAEEVCRAGSCEQSCATVSCGAGEVCRGGSCVEDLCAGAGCAGGEVCNPEDGACVADMCDGVMCPSGAQCRPATGLCSVDRCTFVRCPEGQLCDDGECRLEEMPVEDAGVAVDAGPVSSEDAGSVTFDAGMAEEDTEDRVLAAGGCMCRATGAPDDTPDGWPLALAAAVGILVWRRRRAR